jgi:hypothetical protein
MAEAEKAGGDGPGKPADLASGFAGAAVKWTPETGDPQIAKAFLLGWRMGVALDWAAHGTHEPWPDDDPGLEGPSRWTVLTGQIDAAAKEVTSAAGDAITLPSLGPEPTEGMKSEAVALYRAPLLQRLYVTDQFRGLAFALGADLEAACAGTRRAAPEPKPDEKPSPKQSADALAAQLPALKKSLLGLATKLPPNAAHTVLNSLTLWEEQLERHGQEFDRQKLLTQGGAWRSMLSGDVAAKDLLHLSDYVGTAEQVAVLLHDFVKRTLRGSLLAPALAVLGLAVIGFVLLFFSQTAAAGAGSLIAALGLSWKGLGQYFGKAAAGAEQSLWDGQLDWTIAYRATISLTDVTAPSRASRREKRDAPHAERRRADHFDTWQRWRYEWPVFELEE